MKVLLSETKNIKEWISTKLWLQQSYIYLINPNFSEELNTN